VFLCLRRSCGGGCGVHATMSAMAIVSRCAVFENVGGKCSHRVFTHSRALIYLGGRRDLMCVTKRSSHASDHVHTSRWEWRGVGDTAMAMANSQTGSSKLDGTIVVSSTNALQE
jgi:hypothetical protein